MRKLVVKLSSQKVKTAIKKLMQEFQLEKGEFEKDEKTFILLYKRPYVFTDFRWELVHKKIDYEEITE